MEKLIKTLHPHKTDFELIRLGPNGDGGYLVPDCLEGIKACFSPGVDQVSEFEYDCLKRSIKIFMADQSVNQPNLNVPKEQYQFIKKHIGCINNENYITLDHWVESSYPSNETDLLLQMDIEGGEYLAITNISEKLLQRFRIMVIEFHHLHSLWSHRSFNWINSTFEKILTTHDCVHIHPNNGDGIDQRLGISIPKTMEFTFLIKGYSKVKNYRSNFPHKLDADNTGKKSIVLPKNWYHKKNS